MGLFKKQVDPMEDRRRELNAKIAALESKIKKLNEQPESAPPPGARVRSTAYPGGAPPAAKPLKQDEPVFEKVDQDRLTAAAETPTTPQHFNELGLRKYDLFSLWERLRKQFRGPTAPNPKLVNYLAAGSIQGLRPLRYEKRVARRRFIALALVFVLVMLGIFLGLWHRR